MNIPIMEIIPKATQDAVTFGLALLGAVLGVVNVWRAISRDRVRMKVVPQWYAHTSDFEPGICIEVINMGFAPITVAKVGFLVSTPDEMISYPDTVLLSGERFPHRLEPRASVTAMIPTGAQKDEVFALVTSAFCKTACGQTFTGKSKFLRGCIKAARTSKKHAA